MERPNVGKERLVVPTDFTSPTGSSNVQEDLVPPSHFASTVQFSGAHRGVQSAATPPTVSWLTLGAASIPPGETSPANPWLAITRAQQEILELRKENHQIMMLQENSLGGRMRADHPDHRARSGERSEQWSRWESERRQESERRLESEWRLEAEKHKAEAERWKGQVEALKESAGRHREEIKDRDGTLNRQRLELDAMREELCNTKTELSQIRDKLMHSSALKDKMSSQLEEIAKLKSDVEKSKEDARDLGLKAEIAKSQAEKQAKQQTLRLSEHSEEMRRKQEVELQQLNTSHTAQLGAVRKTNGELQERLQSMTSEVLQMKSALAEVSAERDGLKEHLSQMGEAFETQSATLLSLRNYIGQLAPEKQEKEQLNEAIERLNKEKAALQMTAELLTVRLHSVNEILALQEEKMTLTDPPLKNGSEVLQAIQLWREKVFKLCVQLRSKDIELRGEREKLLSKIRSSEQELQQEHHRASVLRHSLDDRIAELDLERVEKETLRRDLALARKESSQLTAQSQKSEGERDILTEAVHRFKLAFESKVAEVDAAQARLDAFSQRIVFAKRRVETTQGLIMRRVALQKIQQASKQTEQAPDGLTDLQTELSLVCQERDELAQELKRTPQLIQRALADLKEQHESKQRQQQQELTQSWAEVRQAAAGREEAEQGLRCVRAQLEESKVNLEQLGTELLIHQEHSEQVLQERVSEVEDRCAEKVKEMEVRVHAAQKEHTKAVMTLRQFEREASRKRDEAREPRYPRGAHTKRELENTQLVEMEKDKNPRLAPGAERGLMSRFTSSRTAASHNAAAPREQSRKPSASRSSDERLLSVLEELHTLSAAVVHGSGDSAGEEEEGEITSVGPFPGSLHS